MTESLRMVTCTQLLIDPLEVHVEAPPVHVAEPILTPIGKACFFNHFNLCQRVCELSLCRELLLMPTFRESCRLLHQNVLILY